MTLSENGAPMLYVFEGESESGYMIVSADDIAAPVLGYSDSNKFDAENMPDNLRWWLDQYKSEISAAVSSGVTAVYEPSSRAGKAAIAPLVTTRWDQTEPYNLKCPLDAGKRSVTGCVATAFAQLLNYHKYPEKGTGKHSYSWNGTTLSFDYGATTFQWNLMLDKYTADATSNQTNAVATLMYACGVAVDMDYSSKESAAYSYSVPGALIDYFNYDKGVHSVMRDYCTPAEWDDMVYTELKTNGPVYYSGQSNEGGHAFLCDGYKDGYYHFNWGWSGMSDGYFLLNALDPDAQGTGGSNSAFNFNQSVILDVKKPVASSTYADPYIVCYDKLNTQLKNGYLYFVGPFYNFSSRTVKCKFVLDLVDAAGKTTSIDLTREETIKVVYGTNELSVKTSSIPEGTYKGYLMIVSEGKKYPVKMFSSQRGYIDIKKSGNNVTATVPAKCDLTASDFELTTELYKDCPFKISAKVSSNGSTEVSETVVPLLLKSENVNSICAVGSMVNVDVPANGSVDIESLCEWDPESYTIKLTVGDYYLCLATHDGYELSVGDELAQKYKIISPILPVKLKSNLMPASVKVNSWYIEDPTAVDPYNVVAKVNLTGGIGYYTSPIALYIFPQSSGTVSSVAYAMSEPLFISGGETKDVTIVCNLADYLGGVPPVGGKYFGALRDIVKGDWFEAKQIAFTIGESGIEDIVDVTNRGVTVTPNPAVSYASVTASENITGIQLMSMSGAMVACEMDIDGTVATINVSSLPAGIYVARVTTVDGIYTTKVLKR